MGERDGHKRSLRKDVAAAVPLVGAVVGILAAIVAIAVGVRQLVGVDDDSQRPNGSASAITAPSPSSRPLGRIESPESGDPVARDIVARGILANIPEDQHVWLAVRDGNLLYPQEREIPPTDGSWTLRFHQGGAANLVSLELYRMSESGHEFIRERLETQNYSGIRAIPGAKLLHVAEDLRIRD